MTGASVSETGVASSTAMMSAAGRGWHLLREGEAAALADWLAWPLVGAAAEQMVAQFMDMFGREACEASAAWLAARVRITESWLADSAASTYVVLGAGLDSYAWRQSDGRTVVEVDHPATQQWKRERLAALFLADPPELVWAPCDFERESIADALARVDLGSDLPFVSWIGVTPYLTTDAVAATLRKLPACTLVVGYCIPEAEWTGPGEQPTRKFAQLATQSGESLQTFYTPAEFAAVLSDCGFDPMDDVGPEACLERFGHEAFSMGFERLALARKPS